MRVSIRRQLGKLLDKAVHVVPVFCVIQQILLIQTEVMMDRKEPYYNSDSDNVNVIINFNVKVNSQIG